LKTPTFKQWDHLDKDDKARRVKLIQEKLESEKNQVREIFDFSVGLNAHAVLSVAARLDGDLELAQHYLNSAEPFSYANTRYATWVKFKRLEKPFEAVLALAHKMDLLNDTKQLLANDLGLPEELQLVLIKETNQELVGDVGANPCATPKVMELVSDYKNVTARARLAQNPGLSIDLMEKLLADKRQAQVGLAKNLMITDEIKKALFETLDPEVILRLVSRNDTAPSDSLDFVLRSIDKHINSSKYDIQGFAASLQVWAIKQKETPAEIWQGYVISKKPEVFSAVLDRLPADYPNIETILESHLEEYSSTESVIKHPGMTDKLVDITIGKGEEPYNVRALGNPHISEKSVKKLVDVGLKILEKELGSNLEKAKADWVPAPVEHTISWFYHYLNAGGQHMVSKIKDAIDGVEKATNLDLNPNKPSAQYTYPVREITDEILEKFRNHNLGYQAPEIPIEWLIKNAKNRTDEIKKDVLLNPSLPLEAMKIMAMDKKPEIRKALSLLPNCPEDLKALIALQ
jgi:hypothetical protein